MYIPDHTIEEIRSASDIVDIVRDYVQLKRRGSNFVGLCPFHNEKTPSFTVNPGMGIFKCFGCQKGGNVFQFVMELESVSFPEAARTLAKRAHVALPSAPDAKMDREIEAVYHSLRFAAKFFHAQLLSDCGKEALDYLKGRGFTDKTIRRFGLGYAPDQWDALIKAAQAQHIDLRYLELAGMLVRRQDGKGCYDRFRGRTIFPIFSVAGKVIGFGGRVLHPSDDSPKYINSPETRVYAKSKVLFGLSFGKAAVRKAEEAILVEGYTDVISLHQAGIENVIACSGTALTPEQVRVLSRFARRILLLYDADEAGNRAAARGIETVLAGDLSASVVALPQGSDPDSFVREHGNEAFRAYVAQHREDAIAFMYASAARHGALDTADGHAKTVRATLQAIRRVPDSLKREPLLRRASEVFGIPDSALREAFKRLEGSRRTPRREQRPKPDATPETSPPDRALSAEKALLELMLTKGASMVSLVMQYVSLDEFTEGPARDVATRIFDTDREHAIHAQEFLDGQYPEDVQSLVTELLLPRHEVSRNWERLKIEVPRINANEREAVLGAIKQLKLYRINSAIAEHRNAMFKNRDHREAMQPEMMRLTQARQQIVSGAFLQ